MLNIIRLCWFTMRSATQQKMFLAIVCLMLFLLGVFFLPLYRKDSAILDSQHVSIEPGHANGISNRPGMMGPAREEHFIDEFFEPIIDSFRRPDYYKMKTKFRNGSIPTLLVVSGRSLSSSFMRESYYYITHHECPLPCRLIEDKSQSEYADAVLVYLRELDSVEKLLNMFPNRDLSQPWIAHGIECPAKSRAYAHNHLFFHYLDGVFNRTSYFRRDADIVWTHGFVVSKGDAQLLPPTWHLEAPPISKQTGENRTMAVAFISNCNDRSGRLAYINELAQYTTVHIYGKCGNQNQQCGTRRGVVWRFREENDTCLRYVAQKYLFYLSFENNIAEDYVTEKVYNILYYPVIPVVFGGADYTKLLPPNSYVNALHFTPKQLADHLTQLASDKEKYNALLRWRDHYVSSTIRNRRVHCQVCTKLYDPHFYEYNVYDDFYDWYVVKLHSNRRYYPGKNISEFKDYV